jgi:CRP/FNR family transcriptional regulator
LPITPVIPFDSIPLLATIKGEDRAALEPLCRIRAYEKGEVIFREGDVADRIHFVHAGKVKIVKSAGGRDIIIEILSDGEPVGAVAAFQRGHFPATAIAVEPSSLVSLPEREFFRLLEERPQMTRHLLSGLTMRLMMVNKRMADMTGSAESRGARLFLTLAERLGTPQDAGLFIPIALSRQDVADMLGITLETAIRLMSRWQKEALILTEKTGFAIPDPQKLRDLAAS